jgi:hypothetical protein
MAGHEAEVQALLKNENLDKTKIEEQVSKQSGVKTDPAPTKIDPVKTDPVKTDPIKTDVPNPDAIRTAMLNEMFGEQYKTVEDVKNAKIPDALKELVTLRQKNQELSDSLAKKPKHAFASDDIAKFNEFARETGIKDASVFNKINVTDVANMSDMDALVMQHIIDNPSLAGQEPQVRRYLERRYDVDSSKIDHKKVDSGDMTQDEYDENKLEYDTNLIGVTSEAGKAKAKLQELKAKIKMPETTVDEPDKSKKWTPEVEAKQKDTWGKVNTEMYGQFKTLPIRLKGAKEPIVNFVLPEEAQSAMLANATDYAISNQMEVNQENVTAIAKAMYSDIRDTYFEDILHAVFERARTVTEKEMLEVYHNPSSKNTDAPPAGDKPLTAAEKAEKAAQAEMKR